MKELTRGHQKQCGATLITALMMLLVLTILSIAAVKMSTLDILIAGNDQQRLMLIQESETDLITLATPVKLYNPIVNSVLFLGDEDSVGIFEVPAGERNNPLSLETITDMKKLYNCEGFDGKATSIGPNAPPCRVYDFKIFSRKANSGAREKGHRGAGKEVPKTNKESYLGKYWEEEQSAAAMRF